MRFPKNFYNATSVAGGIVSLICFIAIIFLMLLNGVFEVGGDYIGILIYFILPVPLVIGLILIPVGMIRRSRRIKRKGESSVRSWVVIDLKNPRQRNSVMILIFGTIIFLLLTAVGSYQAYHYSESNEFCGTLCHSVMEPEYTAYQASAHSRVTCVECHVGEGTDWYVKSKLSGLYQVYSVTFNKYPTPIETPIHSLRPARETCEECHWPEKFYSYRLHNEISFLADSANTEWNIQLKMKTGSGHSAHGLTEGIHWHVNPDVKIDYISKSNKREAIPLVRYFNQLTGDTIIYRDIYEDLDQEAIDTLESREMDCLDCHNRPSHDYRAPQEFTDDLMAAGKIPAQLPDIKSLAMQVFSTPFETREEGTAYIQSTVHEYYEESYPEFARENLVLIDQAIEGLLEGYRRNFFPKMKVTWDAYPNHIGHIEFNGCFRCHNGNHVSENGQVISRDCDLCHTILAQGEKNKLESTNILESLEFKHPVDVGEAWKEMACSDCHSALY